MATILVVGASSGGSLHPATGEVATLARRLGADLKMSVVGVLPAPSTAEALEQLRTLGFAEAFCFRSPTSPQPVADEQASALAVAVEACGARLILGPHLLDTAEWTTLLGARLGAAVITDCKNAVAIDGRLLVTKMICGGAIGAEYLLNRPLGVVTIRSGVFEAVTNGATCPVRTLEMQPMASTLTVVEELSAAPGEGPALQQASVVVAGGLGLGARENWSLITDTANALGAAVGATRAVVESGWVSANHQVGYSGAKVAPNLYVAIGISGAVHHIAGIEQAKNVVAINSDAAAEIFKVSRFGVVGDAKAVVPAFVARLKELRSGSPAS